MFEHYQRQLHSADVLQRRQAVVKITNSGHPEAQTSLEMLLRTETDSDVKALIQKALHYLKANPATADTQSMVPMGGSEAASPFETGKRANISATTAAPRGPTFLNLSQSPIVSEQKRKVAKGHLEAATQHRFNGKTDKAILELRRALQADPELGKQQFVMGLAAALVGGSSDPVQTILTHTEAKEENLAVVGTVTIGMFLLEMAVIVVIYTLVSAVTYRKALDLLNEFVAFAPTQSSFSLVSILSSAYSVGRDQLFVGTVLQSFSAVVANLILSFMLYVVGVFLGGSGTVLKFIVTSMRVLTAITVAYGIAFLVTPSTVFTRPDATAQAVFALYTSLGLGGLAAWVYYCARAHNFGFLRGCVMVVLTIIVMAILSWMLSAAAVRNLQEMITPGLVLH